MTRNLDVKDLTPEQIEQIYLIIEAFRAINQQQHSFTQEKSLEFEPSQLFFESEILQQFNRSLLYGNRA